MKRLLLAIAVIIPSVGRTAMSRELEASGTYQYAFKDSAALFLDIYEPAPGSRTSIDGVTKPSLLYLYGGGFMEGSRTDSKHLPWFKQMTDDGYRVIAMDYRLALKGITIKMGVRAVNQFYEAIQMAVEDIYSATAFLIENSAGLGIDTDNIVLCGSSAGAIASLQAEWILCNGDTASCCLPQGFNYAGVIAGAGAIFSRKGCVKYGIEPCPTMFMYGDRDKVVPPGQIWLFNISFEGSRKLYRRFCAGKYNRSICRFRGNGHEIAGAFNYNYIEIERFLETNIMKGEMRIMDATITAPEIIKPEWGSKSTAELFNEKRSANISDLSESKAGVLTSEAE